LAVRLDHISKANFECRVRDSDRESCPFGVASPGRVYDPKVSGGDLEEATPDPIPNSEVKLLGADGTAREAVWESRTLPGFFPKSPRTAGSFFLSSQVAEKHDSATKKDRQDAKTPRKEGRNGLGRRRDDRAETRSCALSARSLSFKKSWRLGVLAISPLAK
jgi:hypothetical protein